MLNCPSLQVSCKGRVFILLCNPCKHAYAHGLQDIRSNIQLCLVHRHSCGFVFRGDVSALLPHCFCSLRLMTQTCQTSCTCPSTAPAQRLQTRLMICFASWAALPSFQQQKCWSCCAPLLNAQPHTSAEQHPAAPQDHELGHADPGAAAAIA